MTDQDSKASIKSVNNLLAMDLTIGDIQLWRSNGLLGII